MAKVNKQGKPKPAVFVHGSCVIVRRPDHTVDVCDPTLNTWANFKTERHAKWSATVYTNLSARFGRPLPDPDEAFVHHMVHAYPHLGE
jgi:hypothetical protein